MPPLLDIEDLEVSFDVRGETIHAVDTVSLTVGEGEVVGLVGESGCGKSVTTLSVLRLLPRRTGRITGGAIRFGDDGIDLLALPEKEMNRIRGAKISMVFQEPMTALNPVLTCASQLDEVYRLHRGWKGATARAASIDLLAEVGIADPVATRRSYPHQLSGGMRQRVLLAMALACRPRLLIADEPTTALDATIQARILSLLSDVQRRHRMALLLISHDLGVVGALADRVAVMYAGEIVEEGPVSDVLVTPRHPYTRALLRALPVPGAGGGGMEPIEGNVPDGKAAGAMCRFAPRCTVARSECFRGHPVLLGRPGGGLCRCIPGVMNGDRR